MLIEIEAPGLNPVPTGNNPRLSIGRLTRREIEVLHLLADGLSSREVAGRLKIGFKTATSHRNNILTKLGVHDTVLAVRWGIRKGIIEA